MPAKSTAQRKASRQRAAVRAADTKIASRRAAERAAYVAEYETHDFIVDRDDRPYDPNAYRSRSICLPSDVTYTERQSTKLTGWAGVVAMSNGMDATGTGHNKRTPIR